MDAVHQNKLITLRDILEQHISVRVTIMQNFRLECIGDFWVDFCLVFYAGDTRSRNFVTETGTSRLVPETVNELTKELNSTIVSYRTRVGHSGTRLFARNWAQLYSSTETVKHVTRTMQRDWPEICFGARNKQNKTDDFLCKFLLQVSWVRVTGIKLKMDFHNTPYFVTVSSECRIGIFANAVKHQVGPMCYTI